MNLWPFIPSCTTVMQQWKIGNKTVLRWWGLGWFHHLSSTIWWDWVSPIVLDSFLWDKVFIKQWAQSLPSLMLPGSHSVPSSPDQFSLWFFIVLAYPVWYHDVWTMLSGLPSHQNGKPVNFVSFRYYPKLYTLTATQAPRKIFFKQNYERSARSWAMKSETINPHGNIEYL